MSARYAVEFRPAARKEFKALHASVQASVAKTVDDLAEDPFQAGTKALKGTLRGYRRARVGDYRIAYTVEQQQLIVSVIKIGRRANFYKDLARASIS